MNLSTPRVLLDRLPLPLKGLSQWMLSAIGRHSDPSAPTPHANMQHDGNDDCKQSLITVIEAQILPRLLGAHPHAISLPQSFEHPLLHPSEQEVVQFSQACLGYTDPPPLQMVQALLAKGMLKEQIFLELITPAARLLGQQWTDDEIDFVQVSQGLMHMHQVTRDLGYVNTDIPQAAGDVRRILLACAPGTQHILGLAIVADFFRNAGWQVVVEISNHEQELISAVKAEWFDLIGLSVGLMEQLPTMAPLITKLKKLSRNPQSRVVLGGPALLAPNGMDSLWGSDGVSTDAAEAVQLAIRLMNTP